MSLRHLILAVVSQSPSTGYEIAQEFDTVASFFWRASHQQIYRELAAMADAGLVRFKAVPQDGKPDKKVYSVTSKGRREFADWFAQPSLMPRPSDALMIKFFAGELGGTERLREQLALARVDHDNYLRMLQAIEKEHYSESLDQMPVWKACIYLSLRLGIARERAWLEWAAFSNKALLELAQRG
jgi:PadR family transcriptional regulator, regulatory protein AphA